jgi:acyl-CoA reductase-like NAD-dependent aldehyde dehydrogenase
MALPRRADHDATALPPPATEAHVNAAVEAAAGAFGYWSGLSGHQRAEYLDAVADAVKARKQHL